MFTVSFIPASLSTSHYQKIFAEVCDQNPLYSTLFTQSRMVFWRLLTDWGGPKSPPFPYLKYIIHFYNDETWHSYALTKEYIIKLRDTPLEVS